MIELKEVVSSNIAKAGFDNGLVVEYKSGVKYKYKDVPEELYEQFLKAESKGSFMNKYIKGTYDFEKLVI